jgi:hypothetical protein
MRANVILLACAFVALFPLPTAHAEDPPVHVAPDLCEEPVYSVTGEVYMDLLGQTISRFCKPRIDPPVFDHEVCCSIGTSASCKLPSSVGRCSTGMKFWCEYGEPIGTSVVCYQDGPNMCDLGLCGASYGGTPWVDTSWVCCDEEGECTYVGEGGMTPPAEASCAGSFTMCSDGSTNEDGTVNCEG